MRRPAPYQPGAESPRLWRRLRTDREEFWTEAVGPPPSVHGERWTSFDGRALRAFEPPRSKLAAALAAGWTAPLPRVGERWLYLGAASGTTASHVADLVGPAGRVYAVERSLRPFARLLKLAERWPNLLPILADAREPDQYADRVPVVEGIYADVAQPGQAELAEANAQRYLDPTAGALLLALKTSSLGRAASRTAHLHSALSALEGTVRLEEPIRLDPFYRSHYLVGGRAGTPGARPAAPSARRRDGPPRPSFERRRRFRRSDRRD